MPTRRDRLAKLSRNVGSAISNFGSPLAPENNGAHEGQREQIRIRELYYRGYRHR